jgi:O-antigen/teichoic acid export membrane protein
MKSDPPPDEPITSRDRWALLSTLLFVLGGGILCLLGFNAAISRYYPELSEGTLSGPEALFVLVVFPVVFAIGALLGATALLFVWRPFSTREQLEQFNRPRLPVISPLLTFVIGLLYPGGGQSE